MLLSKMRCLHKLWENTTAQYILANNVCIFYSSLILYIHLLDTLLPFKAKPHLTLGERHCRSSTVWLSITGLTDHDINMLTHAGRSQQGDKPLDHGATHVILVLHIYATAVLIYDH